MCARVCASAKRGFNSKAQRCRGLRSEETFWLEAVLEMHCACNKICLLDVMPDALCTRQCVHTPHILEAHVAGR